LESQERVAIPPYSSGQFPRGSGGLRQCRSQTEESRNPTVLIWSIPTRQTLQQLQPPAPREVAIPPYSSGQFPRRSSRPHGDVAIAFRQRRNPTVLIWSTHTEPLSRYGATDVTRKSQSHRTHLVKSHEDGRRPQPINVRGRNPTYASNPIRASSQFTRREAARADGGV
jgi:hypothetical protein